MLRTKLIADSLSLISTLPSLPDTQIRKWLWAISLPETMFTHPKSLILFYNVTFLILHQFSPCPSSRCDVPVVNQPVPEVLSANGMERRPPQRRSWHGAECTHRGVYANSSALTTSINISMFFRYVVVLCNF